MVFGVTVYSIPLTWEWVPHLWGPPLCEKDVLYKHDVKYFSDCRGLRPQCYICLFCQVQAAIRSSGSSKAAVSEGVEASVIYVRFKAAASEVVFFWFKTKLLYEWRINYRLLTMAMTGVR